MADTASKGNGPHQAIAAANERERFALELFDILWDLYRQRVSYVGTYEQVISQAGATFVNDDIAFRTFACQRPTTGIVSLSRIFEALGYRAAGSYHFEDKQLSAIHYQHANSQFPKLFISELKVWELNDDARERIQRTLQSHREPLADETLAALMALDGGTLRQLPGNGLPPRSSGSRETSGPRTLTSSATVSLSTGSCLTGRTQLMDAVVRQFHELPWQLPEKDDVLALSKTSQYAAWVLVHGYNVNHFTSLINSHGVEQLNDIEKTIAALQRAGVPMKSEIEGERGSKLRQTATEAVTIDVAVRAAGQPTNIPWTYAYFELAERGQVPDPTTRRETRFEGFLGPQATNLFEMTKVK